MLGQPASEASCADYPTMLAFCRDAAGRPASAVMRSGDNFQLTIGAQTCLISSLDLERALRDGELDAESVFIRSLLVCEAAINAHLRHSTARCLLKAFAEATAAGVNPWQAQQDAFLNAALACDVEAYVTHKNGLATDLRRVGSFTEDAMQAAGGGALAADAEDDAVSPEQADAIVRYQQTLDSTLNAFMDAVAEAQASGNYATAFDARQQFFQVAATVIETDYWRQRSATWSRDLALADTMNAIARAKSTPSRLAEAIAERHR